MKKNHKALIRLLVLLLITVLCYLFFNYFSTTLAGSNIIKQEVESDTYIVNNDDKYISNVRTLTSLDDFKNALKLTSTNYKIVNSSRDELAETDIIATGDKLIIDDTTVYKISVTGDASGDGKADITDIFAINKHRLNISQLKDEFYNAGNPNNDNNIDIKDILQINNYRLNQIDTLVKPNIMGNVEIAGDTNYNSKLTAVVSGLDPEDASLSYQWYYSDRSNATVAEIINNATSNEYTIGSNLSNKYIYVVVIAQKDGFVDLKMVDNTDAVLANVITPPEASNKAYTGESQTSFSAGDGYTVTNNTGINAGDYEGKAILKDKINTTWNDGTTEDKTINWSISPIEISVDWEVPLSWTYDGNNHVPTVSTPVDGVNNEKINLTVSGGQTDIGNHTATASISSVTGGQEKTSNYILEESSKTISFAIVSKTIAPPTASNKTYTGAIQTSFSAGDGYTVTNNTGIDAGDYVGTASLIDKANTSWNDGTKEDKTLNWSITPKEITINWGTNFRWTYDGNNHVPTLVTPVECVNNETINFTVSGAASSVGVHTATAHIASVTSGQQKASNYVISESTETISFVIADTPVITTFTPPTANNKTYTGTVQTSFSASEGYTVTNNTGIDAGNYSGKASLTDKMNSTWSDGTITDKTLNWSIAPKEISVTWGSTTSWTFDGNNHAPTVTTPINGVNSETINITVSGAQKNAGNHTATAGISSVSSGQQKASNYKISDSTKTKSYTITTKAITSSVSNKTSNYTGSVISPNKVTVSDPASGATIKYGTANGTYNLTAPKTYTNAGTYTIYYQVTATNYTTKTGSYTLTINKIDPTHAVSGNSLTYNGSAQTLGKVTTNGGAVTYCTTSGGTYSSTCPTKTNAGTYTTYYKIAETTNYKSYSGNFSTTIATKAMTVTASNKTANYTGSSISPNKVTVTTPSSGATVKYGTSSGTYNLTTPQSYTNAGTYTVYYQVTASNYTTKTGSYTLTINKIDPTHTVSGNSLTYNGSAQTLGKITTNGGAVTYCATSGGTYSSTCPKQTNAGTYTTYYKIAASTNYKAYSGSFSTTIATKAITSSVSNKQAYFTGSAIAPNTVAVSDPSSGATIKYGTASGTYNLNSPQSYTNAGTYTIYYKITASNYTAKTGSYTLTIVKINPTATVSGNSLTYNGSAQTLGKVTTNGGAVTYCATQNGTYSSTCPKQTKLGTYTTYYKIAESTNYRAYSGSFTTTIVRGTRQFLSNDDITLNKVFATKVTDIKSSLRCTQGFCTDGQYFYFAICSSYSKDDYTDQQNLIIKTDLSGNIKAKVNVGTIGHCNCLAYNPTNQTIIIAPCSKAYKCLYQIPANFNSSTTVTKVTPKAEDGSNFLLKSDGTYRSIGSVIYDSVTQQYLIKTSQTTFVFFDNNFKYVKTLTLSENIKKDDTYTGQSSFTDGKYIYGVYTKSDKSYFSVFNMDTGKLVCRRNVGKVVSSGTFEMEQITVIGDTFYCNGNYRPNGTDYKNTKLVVYKMNITK